MGFVVLLAAAGLIGAWCARPLGLRMDGEGIALRFLLGYTLCAVFAVAAGSVSTPFVRHALLVFTVVALGLDVYRASRKRSRQEPDTNRRASIPRLGQGIVETVCQGVVTFIMGCALIGVLAPITSWDASVAHLALPAAYVRDGQMGLLEGNAYSAYPHFMHSLFTAAFALGGETGTALCSFSLAVIGTAVIYHLGERLAGRRCGWLAAAIFVSAPIFIDQAGTVAIDLAFAVYTLAALHCLVAWQQDKRTMWLVLAAILAGSSCGIRHTGYLTCAIAMLWVATSGQPRRVRNGALFAGLIMAAALPWLVRSFVLTANPFYPFFNEVLGTGPADPAITGLTQHESLRGASVGAFLTFPLRIVLRPYDFDGLSQSPGPWILLLGVPGIAFGGAMAWRLGGFSLIGGACLFFFRQYARYFLPFFVPMMAVAAVAAEKSPWWRRTIAVMLCFSFLYGSAYALATVHFKVPVVLRLESRDDYLRQRVERHDAHAWINRNVPDGATVLLTDMRGYYIKRPTFQNLEALYPIMEKPVWEQVNWLRDHQIEYWLYCDAYVDESPGFREGGLYYMFQRWRRDVHFQRVRFFSLARPGSNESELVELYRVVYD